MEQVKNNKYPDLTKFSREIGIPEENLVKAFEIERNFHNIILKELSFKKRKAMYTDVYKAVHPIYGQTTNNIFNGKNPKDEVVLLFRKELAEKEILDVGCGEGYFLASISKQLKHRKLVGIDVSIPPLSKLHKDIEFIETDIINFRIGKKFDVVFSDQVLEHIAPKDVASHLISVKNSLVARGLLIVRMPNKLFGPSDVTRIIDFSYKGKTMAQGTHLNELTYKELLFILRENGFCDCKTIFPIPKIGRLFKNLRINPSFLVALEENTFLMSILHNIKFRGQCIPKLGITIICSKE